MTFLLQRSVNNRKIIHKHRESQRKADEKSEASGNCLGTFLFTNEIEAISV